MNETQQALQTWLNGHVKRWQWLEEQCRLQTGKRLNSSRSSIEFIEAYRALGSDLSLSRATAPDARLSRYLASLFTRAHDQIHRSPHAFWRTLKDVFLREAPSVVYEIRGVITATIFLFLMSLCCGWWLVSAFPELVGLFASQEMVDTVESGELWTDGLLNILPSSMLALSIIANNITVTLFAFALGAFYGVGTIYVISLNGLMLGGVFAFTAANGLDGRLFEFVVAHGVVELSAVCLAGAAGVNLGESLIRPGNRTRIEAFRMAVRRGGVLLVVVAPFLVGAGLIEGYISPNPEYTMQTRVLVGVAYGAVFWLLLTRFLWQPQAARKPVP